ncbi:unnamed protein product [Ilex paraguariensis]|uniref:Uncharacterized protein n=1 Tax=Ilex paraguariensis TaxID=185542 RepID=A0ABC8SDG8_9AQUA
MCIISKGSGAVADDLAVAVVNGGAAVVSVGWVSWDVGGCGMVSVNHSNLQDRPKLHGGFSQSVVWPDLVVRADQVGRWVLGMSSGGERMNDGSSGNVFGG